MTALLAVLALLLHLALMLAAAPLLVGGIRTLEARLLGRAGPPLLQPWRDLRRLARKERVLAENASLLFRVAPAVHLAVGIAVAALIPSFTTGMATAPLADLLVVAGLLGLARATLVLAAMDVGTGFGGLGASRAALFASFAEPVLLLVWLTLALLVGTTNLDVIAASLRDGGYGLRISLVLAAAALAVAAVVENGRVPADNPTTHLELTMVHEAMLLEYSGPDLALLEGAAALRLLCWLSLLAVLFAPFGSAMPEPALATAGYWLLGLLAWAAKIVVLAAGLVLLEVGVAKLRLFRVPGLLGLAALLGVLAAVFLFISQGFA